jgi:hypothetical protein
MIEEWADTRNSPNEPEFVRLIAGKDWLARCLPRFSQRLVKN